MATSNPQIQETLKQATTVPETNENNESEVANDNLIQALETQLNQVNQELDKLQNELQSAPQSHDLEKEQKKDSENFADSIKSLTFMLPIDQKPRMTIKELGKNLVNIVTWSSSNEVDARLAAFDAELNNFTFDIDEVISENLDRFRFTYLGSWVLHSKLNSYYENIISFLLKRGANPTFRPPTLKNGHYRTNPLPGISAVECALNNCDFKVLQILLQNKEYVDAPCLFKNIFSTPNNRKNVTLTPLECITDEYYLNALTSIYPRKLRLNQCIDLIRFLFNLGAKITPTVIAHFDRMWRCRDNVDHMKFIHDAIMPAYLLLLKQNILELRPSSVQYLQEETIYCLSKTNHPEGSGPHYKETTLQQYFFPKIILPIVEMYSELFQVMKALGASGTQFSKPLAQIILNYYSDEFEQRFGVCPLENNISDCATAFFDDSATTGLQVLPLQFSLFKEREDEATVEKNLLCAFEVEALKNNADPKSCTWLFSAHYVKKDLSTAEDLQLCQAITEKRAKGVLKGPGKDKV